MIDDVLDHRDSAVACDVYADPSAVGKHRIDMGIIGVLIIVILQIGQVSALPGVPEGHEQCLANSSFVLFHGLTPFCLSCLFFEHLQELFLRKLFNDFVRIKVEFHLTINFSDLDALVQLP